MIFRCRTHGEFEVDLKYRQEPPIWCPIYKAGANEPCGIKLTRRYSIPAISFKGSGFFINDNKEK